MVGSLIIAGCSVDGDNMSNEQVVSWSDYKVRDSTHVSLDVITGDPNCFGLRTVVRESDSTIGIAVIQGTLPRAPRHCKSVGRRETVIVETISPIGHRTITRLSPDEVKLNK